MHLVYVQTLDREHPEERRWLKDLEDDRVGGDHGEGGGDRGLDLLNRASLPRPKRAALARLPRPQGRS